MTAEDAPDRTAELEGRYGLPLVRHPSRPTVVGFAEVRARDIRPDDAIVHDYEWCVVRHVVVEGGDVGDFPPTGDERRQSLVDVTRCSGRIGLVLTRPGSTTPYVLVLDEAEAVHVQVMLPADGTATPLRTHTA